MEHEDTKTPARPLLFGTALALAVCVADTPTLYANDLARVEMSLPPELRDYIYEASPDSVPEPFRDSIAAFRRTAVLAVAPLNKHTTDQVSAAVTNLVNWAHATKGFPLKFRLLFSSQIIGLWQSHVLASGALGQGTTRNYLRHLRRVAHALGVELDDEFEPITRTARATPYAEDDLQRLLLWGRTLRSEASRRRALALIALGAGAGLCAEEIVLVRRSSFIAGDGMWVRVDGAQARLVPVAVDWSPRLRRLLESMETDEFIVPRDGDITTGALLKAWLKNHPRQTRPSPRRLRTTWIVNQLRSDDSRDVELLAWSGIDRGETLAGYLPLAGIDNRQRRQNLLRLKTKVPKNGPETTSAAHKRKEGGA